MWRACREGWYWHPAWAAVLAANLIVPAPLGWEVTRDGDRGGLVGGVALLWAAGHLLLARVPAAGRPVVLGGVVTALTQLFPVLQIMAGLTSLWVVRMASDPDPDPDGGMSARGMTDAEAFAATLLTAAQVGMVALVCGPFVRALAEFVGDVVAAARAPAAPPDAPRRLH